MRGWEGCKKWTHLDPVNELVDRDVHLVAQSVVGLEVVLGAVLELDPQEVTVLRRGPQRISKVRAEA